MTEFDMSVRLRLLTKLEDFLVVLKKEQGVVYGKYFPNNKLILVYALDKDTGEELDEDELMDTALHELAHHLHFYYSDCPPEKDEVHNKRFYEIFDNLKEEYYNKLVPLLKAVEERRKTHESKEERGLSN